MGMSMACPWRESACCCCCLEAFRLVRYVPLPTLPFPLGCISAVLLHTRPLRTNAVLVVAGFEKRKTQPWRHLERLLGETTDRCSSSSRLVWCGVWWTDLPTDSIPKCKAAYHHVRSAQDGSQASHENVGPPPCCSTQEALLEWEWNGRGWSSVQWCDVNNR